MPVFTVALIALNVAVFLYELNLLSQGPRLLQQFIDHMAMFPEHVAHDFGRDAVRTIFTSMFLHGGLLHIGGNMLYLWVFGNNVEDSMGHFRFLVFYLLCGVAAAAGHVIVSPDSSVPTMGASGAIAGVLGAYLLLFPSARIDTWIPIFWLALTTIQVPAYFFLVFWFILQVINALPLLAFESVKEPVAWWAHIGGFVAGVILTPILKRREVRLFQ